MERVSRATLTPVVTGPGVRRDDVYAVRVTRSGSANIHIDTAKLVGANSNPPRNSDRKEERKNLVKMLTASAFAIGLSLMAMSASKAMPLAPLDQSASADTIRVSGGCGPFWHRGPYGGCRPLYNCPPGWHSGPFGHHCFRNGW
jgi:hypothetical protein